MPKRLDLSALREELFLPAEFPAVGHTYTQRYRSLQDLHLHSHAECGVCLEGSGVFFIGNRTYPFGKDTISFIRPGTPHIAQSTHDRPSRWWFLSYSPAFFGGEPQGTDWVFQDMDCLSALQIVRRELEKTDGDRETAALALRLAVRLGDHCTHVVQPFEREDGLSEGLIAILPAVHAIAERFAERLGVEELAALCHMSVSRFRVIFRVNIGVPPLTYLTRTRMLAAAQALRETDRPIALIATGVGYASLSAFNRHFRATFSIPPREYRQNQRSLEASRPPLLHE